MKEIIPVFPALSRSKKQVGGMVNRAISFTKGLPPLSLYIHVPWCVKKCPYCDFNSHAQKGELPEEHYLNALAADLEQTLPLIWGRQIHTVFIGGGTPSLLSAQAVERMMAMLRNYLNIWPDTEVTLEANPGTAEALRFKQYAESGINRISLGIQSFDDTALGILGRIHDSRQAIEAIEMAQKAVGRINLDLMYALPGQTLESCKKDIETALSFDTEHLSLYHLTMEPNTVFAKYPPSGLPDDDTSAALQDMLIELTASRGLEQYEVSAYARPGARARHNVNYWEFGDYIGIGPGAHGKLSFHDRIVRTAKVRNPESWMEKAVLRNGSHLAEERELASSELPFEFMLNALRLKEGVPVSCFEERTSLSLAGISRQLEAALKKDLLDVDPMRIKASPLGWRFLNDLQGLFL